MTGYEVLQQAVAEAQRLLNEERARLTAMQQNAEYVRVRTILSDSRVMNNPRAWIDSAGTYWEGNDAASAHTAGANFRNNHEALMGEQSSVITRAQTALNDARQALTDYEKNSPIGQQAAQSAADSAKDAASKKTLIVTVVIVGIVVIVVSVVTYFVRKKKKATA